MRCKDDGDVKELKKKKSSIKKREGEPNDEQQYEK